MSSLQPTPAVVDSISYDVLNAPSTLAPDAASGKQQFLSELNQMVEMLARDATLANRERDTVDRLWHQVTAFRADSTRGSEIVPAINQYEAIRTRLGAAARSAPPPAVALGAWCRMIDPTHHIVYPDVAPPDTLEQSATTANTHLRNPQDPLRIAINQWLEEFHHHPEVSPVAQSAAEHDRAIHAVTPQYPPYRLERLAAWARDRIADVMAAAARAGDPNDPALHDVTPDMPPPRTAPAHHDDGLEDLVMWAAAAFGAVKILPKLKFKLNLGKLKLFRRR